MRRNFLKRVQMLSYCLGVLFITGCDKEFLDAKPDKSLLIPSTLEDYEKIIYNEQIMNLFGPGVSNLCSDDAYISDVVMNGDRLSDNEKKAYVWDNTMFDAAKVGTDWTECYERIFYANVVLEGLVRLKPTVIDLTKWNKLYGSALFFRALGHYQLLNVFSSIYNETDADSQLGIPLRLSADINDRSGRSTIKESYYAVVSDLQKSISYLDKKVDRASLPDQASSWALLARVYLAMSKFPEASNSANEALNINNALIDYNLLDLNSSKPIPAPMPVNNNVEVLFFSQYTGKWRFPDYGYVNPDLIALYTPNDIRNKVFFKNVGVNLHQFVGSYNRTALLFNGLTTAEMLLIKAECLIRTGMVIETKQVLSKLQEKRYLKGTAPNLNLLTEKELLQEVLLERRRELVFRDIRWSDMKRLNLEKDFQTTIIRKVNGTEYTLLPNSTMYVLPIPYLLELELNDLTQNP
jgi:tetratricopeptide (TPR) repeat protein